MQVCLTFDVDLTDYVGGRESFDLDELQRALPVINSSFQRHPQWKATWFVRLDSQMEALYGSADAAFRRYENELAYLQSAGHKLGWHFHSYIQSDGKWRQNVQVSAVVDELVRYAPLAKYYDLRVVRMGWGVHSAEIMHLLAEQGFVVDSSAIPRPKYTWDRSVVDWSVTPSYPFFPSVADYRVPGEPHFPILEVPISCIEVQAPYDAGPVVRYLNLAYHPHIFRPALENWMRRYTHLVTITHPYELMPNAEAHGLLAFGQNVLEQNILTIEELASDSGLTADFLTLSEMAVFWKEQNEQVHRTDSRVHTARRQLYHRLPVHPQRHGYHRCGAGERWI